MIRDRLRRFAGGREPDPDSGLERELSTLEAQASAALPGYEAQFLNRAGDLCLGAGQRRRALSYFGRAIDACLIAGRYDAAGGVCRKLLRIAPRAVRTRATLAWLSLGKGHIGDARQEIEEYVKSAVREGQETRAVRQLAFMARATWNPDLRRLLAQHMTALGASAEARAVMAELERTYDPRAVPTPEQQDALWEQVLKAALMGPADLDRESDFTNESDAPLPEL